MSSCGGASNDNRNIVEPKGKRQKAKGSFSEQLRVFFFFDFDFGERVFFFFDFDFGERVLDCVVVCVYI